MHFKCTGGCYGEKDTYRKNTLEKVKGETLGISREQPLLQLFNEILILNEKIMFLK